MNGFGAPSLSSQCQTAHATHGHPSGRVAASYGTIFDMKTVTAKHLRPIQHLPVSRRCFLLDARLDDRTTPLEIGASACAAF